MIIFLTLMIFTSILKTQTRILEKKIFSYQKRISSLNNNIYEAQIDYHYLSSPSLISEKILSYSDDNYHSIKYSEIYFSVNQFLKDKIKFTKMHK